VVLGIVDTGADQTQIPETAARDLQLRPTSDITLTNADGSQRTCLVYAAIVELEGLSFPFLEVIGSNLPLALIGRDILNQLLAQFDGPSLSFSVDRPNPQSEPVQDPA
jgi:predicted aspartyl protease